MHHLLDVIAPPQRSKVTWQMSSFEVYVEVDALPGWSLKIKHKSFQSVMPLWGPFSRVNVCVSISALTCTYVFGIERGMCVKKSLKIANPLHTCIKYKSHDYRPSQGKNSGEREHTHPKCARGVCVFQWQVSQSFLGLHSGTGSLKTRQYNKCTETNPILNW